MAWTIAIVGASACRKDSPAHDAAAPALDSLPPASAAQLSHFNVPLRYDFSPVLDIVERVVPRTFGAIDSVHTVGNDESKHYAYEAVRGPFTAFAQGNRLHLRATLSYAARGFYKPRIGPTLSAGCGNDQERPRVVVELATPVTLSQNWHLVSHARIARLEPASTQDRDRCTVTIINYDVTPLVIDAARKALVSQLPSIDRKIADVDLTSHFTEWWGLLNKPIHLTDELWLLLEPYRLRMGRVTGSGRELTVQAGLDARPQIVTGAEPHPEVPPLPPLAHDTVADGFRILLEGIVDYRTATSAITDALAGKVVTQAGRTVTIRRVAVTPLPHGRLALSVSFTGDANGTLAFTGTPRYTGGEITVPDLDYDLETDSDLIKAYSWLRSDALRSLFREKARVPAGSLIDRGRELLVAGLNRKLGDAVTLSATVDSVGVAGIFVTRPGVVVRALAGGHAGVFVRQQR